MGGPSSGSESLEELQEPLQKAAEEQGRQLEELGHFGFLWFVGLVPDWLGTVGLAQFG